MLYTLSYRCGSLKMHSIGYDVSELGVSLDVAKGWDLVDRL